MKKSLSIPKMRRCYFALAFILSPITSLAQPGDPPEPLYMQYGEPYGEARSQWYLNHGTGPETIVRSADDFEVFFGAQWTISHIDVEGNASGTYTGYHFIGVVVEIYSDSAGKPHTKIYDSGELEAVMYPDGGNLNITLPDGGPVLNEGIYWLTVYTKTFNDAEVSWAWKTTTEVNQHAAQYRNELSLFPQAVDWMPYHNVHNEPPVDLLFRLSGKSRYNHTGRGAASGLREATQLYRSAVDRSQSSLTLEAYPNPARENFRINIASPHEEEVNMEIYDLKGQKRFSGKAQGNTVLEIDTQAYPPGVYILKAKQRAYHRTVKLVKL